MCPKRKCPREIGNKQDQYLPETVVSPGNKQRQQWLNKVIRVLPCHLKHELLENCHTSLTLFLHLKVIMNPNGLCTVVWNTRGLMGAIE